MAYRQTTTQSSHDAAVRAAQQIYQQRGIRAWSNPGGEKNLSWSGWWIDVIADAGDNRAWVVEVETADSVTEAEARDQWQDYDKAYTTWHLAVPQGFETQARALVTRYALSHCTVISWAKNPNGTHTFWGLPGI